MAISHKNRNQDAMLLDLEVMAIAIHFCMPGNNTGKRSSDQYRLPYLGSKVASSQCSSSTLG